MPAREAHEVGERVPLVVLTGFLGAGKTTALNRILKTGPNRRVGVVVNELGRIDVDARLLRAVSADVVELAGGCVCHEIRTQEELWEGLRELIARARPELIVLETTGIAEPEAILDGLMHLPEDDRLVQAAGVLTVVDAEVGLDTLARFPEAVQQVKAADAIVLSKLDRASSAQLSALHARLFALNPGAERVSFPSGPEGDAELCAWLLASRYRMTEHPHAHAHGAHAHGQLVAAAYSDDVPLSEVALRALLDAWGPDLVRVKGFVRLAGRARPVFVERAGAVTGLRSVEGDTAPSRTELVFIGVGLDPASVKRQLWACRVMEGGP